jgi:FkbM family methyltransferase
MRRDPKFALLRFGNQIYQRAYPVYLPLYRLYKSISDRTERRALRKLVHPGMSVVDVGANIGVYTRFLAKLVGQGGHVVAFEPEPKNFSRLVKNVGTFSNVLTVGAAVSDHPGEIPLFYSEHLNVDHQTYDNGEERTQVLVPALTLDGFFEAGKQIDFVKIDVQGFEYHVLKGARRVLQDSVNVVVLMEYWPFGLQKAGVDSHALLDLVASMGFSWQALDPSAVKVQMMDVHREDHYCNLLLMKEAVRPRADH